MFQYSEPSPLEAFTAEALRANDGKPLYLTKDGLVFPVRVKINPGSDRLFVMLNGAVDRRTMEFPTFARWNWGKILRGHVISVCDPTLYLDEKLRLGWFIGSAATSAMPGLIEITERTALHLELSPGRTIFYGSSGGGFAAIAAACSVPKGRAVAINPQIDITKYYPRPIARLKQALGGDGAFAELCRDPRRIRLKESIDEARRTDMGTRLVIHQNTVDCFHHEKHFLKLMADLRVPLRGGRSPQGDILAALYCSPEGHSAEPPEVVKDILRISIPFLLDEAIEGTMQLEATKTAGGTDMTDSVARDLAKIQIGGLADEAGIPLVDIIEAGLADTGLEVHGWDVSDVLRIIARAAAKSRA